MYEQTKGFIIKGNLRRIFLRSKERSFAMKRAKYCCEQCGIKKSVKKGFEVKVDVHHKKGILNWDILIKEIRKQLFCDPKDLEVLCKPCHAKITYNSPIPN